MITLLRELPHVLCVDVYEHGNMDMDTLHNRCFLPAFLSSNNLLCAENIFSNQPANQGIHCLWTVNTIKARSMHTSHRILRTRLEHKSSSYWDFHDGCNSICTYHFQKSPIRKSEIPITFPNKTHIKYKRQHYRMETMSQS